jgi:D-3-phosphoglycerate dehydrogenase
MLGSTFFEAMKQGSIFINTSRAEVVDQAALEKVLNEGKIRAGLDVFDDEPSTPEGEYSGSLKSQSNAYCTHHIGASTDQAQEAVADETVRIVDEFQKTGTPPNAVNSPNL